MDLDMNKIKKLAITVIIVVVVVLAVYRLGLLVADKMASHRQSRQLDNSIDRKNLSYDENQYQTFANVLYKAMKGAGTDENAVKDVFSQMLTRSDVLKLISVFGVKDGENLGEWINDDFSSSGKETYVNKVLEVNSVNYKF